MQNVTCMCLSMTHRFLFCFVFFLDDAPITQLLPATGVLIPLEAAADELIDLRGFLLMAENSICFMQNKVSLPLYGVVSSIRSSLWGHSCMSRLSLCLWYSLTHACTQGGLDSGVFSRLLEEDLDQPSPGRSSLCSASQPPRAGRVSSA